MKLPALIALLSTALAAQPTPADKDRHAQELRDFGLGARAGSCLVVKCQVFRGVMLTDSPRSGEPVAIRVTEWLFGDRSTNDTVLVPYDTNLAEFGRGGTVRAWWRAHMSPREPITVLMAQESGFDVHAGEPALITFGEREADLIRSVTDEALRLKRTPELLSADVTSVSSRSSPALAGYLLRYVIFSKDTRPLGLSAQLLLQMLGSPAIPAERWSLIPLHLIAYSGSLPPEQRPAVVLRFVELAGQEDDNAARAGFLGLGIIAGQAGNTLRAR